jgi:hypothetical protein
VCCFPNDASGCLAQDGGVIKNWMRSPKFMLCFLPQLIYPDDKVGCADGSVRSRSRWNAQFVQYRPCHICRVCCIRGVFLSHGHLLQVEGNFLPREEAYSFVVM